MNQTEIDSRDGIQLELDTEPSTSTAHNPIYCKQEGCSNKRPGGYHYCWCHRYQESGLNFYGQHLRPDQPPVARNFGDSPAGPDDEWADTVRTLLGEYQPVDQFQLVRLATPRVKAILGRMAELQRELGQALDEKSDLSARVAELEKSLYPLAQAHPLTEAEEYEQAVIRG